MKKGPHKPAPDASSSGEEQDNVAVTVDTCIKTAKPPKKFMLPIMFKQINDSLRLQAPRKMLQMYIQKTESQREKGDGTQNVAEEKPYTVDDKGDSTTVKEQADVSISPTTSAEVTESTNAQETVDSKARTEETAQNTKTEKVEKEIDLDYLKVFGSIKEVNEFLDMESEYIFLFIIFYSVN